ncbi:hypothetical protein [Kitasatospora sp. NRRL B-11411]|uniref:DUF7489 domain-containing protein n=1 Tax=Kitasatospora sp. NRRL B-11411 TaxID=1463822 RepID=UPI0004C45381|nr:hypothetical protein [Kitasatospora sp. NRRL B-11411]
MSYLILLVLIAGPLILALVAFADRRRRSANNSYAGEIIDRWTRTGYSTTGPTESFWLRIRTDDGGELTVCVDGVSYEKLKTGDRVMRTPATRRPVRPKQAP